MDLEFGVLAGELGEHGREQRPGGRWGRRRRAGRRFVVARQRRLGRLELAQHRLGAGGQLAAGRREPAAAAVALEQVHAGLALERGELLGDRGGV